jgi:alkylhydroperoxidase family enzyme
LITSGDGVASIDVEQARLAAEAVSGLTFLREAVGRTSNAPLLELLGLRLTQLIVGRGQPPLAVPPAVPEEKREALATWATSPLFTEAERVALDFTEQFVIDVAGISADQRSAVGRVFGGEALVTLVVALFVLDYDLRARLAFDRLSLRDPGRASGRDPEPGEVGNERGPVDAGVLLTDLDRFQRSVAQLAGVDPVTAELVRLRGARHHNCRLCRSIRSRSAVGATGDEAWFDRTEHYESSDLRQSQKVALRLTDALITEPAAIDASLASSLRAFYSEEQILELVLDVVRNSSQKIAVALAADDPHVAAGTELFDLAPDGTVVFLG